MKPNTLSILIELLEQAVRDTENTRNLDKKNIHMDLQDIKKDIKGIDLWAANERRKLLDGAQEVVIKLLEYSHKKKHGQYKTQNLLNPNAVLAKPGGGTRTACKTPMLYRICLRARQEVTEWENT